MRVAIALIFCAVACLGQSGFSLASIKPSQHLEGKDYGDRVTFFPTGLSGKNVSLKKLIIEAYALQPFQVSGPNWLDTNEYEVEARVDAPLAKEQLRPMLQTLLAERFGLKLHRDFKELRVYELVVEKNGPKIRPAADGESGDPTPHFRGTMQQFCSLLAVKLTIPIMDDPTQPGMAGGPPVPVIDKTGLDGIYELPMEINRPEPGADMFVLWQRALREVGLKLESRKSTVEVLVVDRAERVPVSN